MASMPPGIFLSQPPMTITPSMRAALQTVSMESAITSRETRENFMPSVPIEIPSLTVMVPKICGMAWASRSTLTARCGEIVQARVAGRDGAVAVGDADDGLVEILVAKAHGAEHGAIRSALDSLSYEPASFIHTHLKFAFLKRMSLSVGAAEDASEILNSAIEKTARPDGGSIGDEGCKCIATGPQRLKPRTVFGGGGTTEVAP